MEQVPSNTKERTPSSRVPEELLDQAPADYFTLGWLTVTLRQRSFFIMLFLELLATVPVGSTVPGLMLVALAAQMIAGRREPIVPHFIAARLLPTRHLSGLVGALFLCCSSDKGGRRACDPFDKKITPNAKRIGVSKQLTNWLLSDTASGGTGHPVRLVGAYSHHFAVPPARRCRSRRPAASRRHAYYRRSDVPRLHIAGPHAWGPRCNGMTPHL